MIHLCLPAFSQNNVGIGTQKPDPSALLDIQSLDKGVLVPRMTTEQMQAIVMPVSGLLIYNTSTSSFWYYKNAVDTWMEINPTERKGRL